MDPSEYPMNGACYCKTITYTLNAPPIFVNCCHCRNCQCFSGSAFALNIVIEASNINVTSNTKPVTKVEKTQDGQPSTSTQDSCPECQVMLWGTIEAFGNGVKFLRAGTLLENEKIIPSAHFFMRSKHPWVTVPDGARKFETLPNENDPPLFSEEAKKRLEAAKAASSG